MVQMIIRESQSERTVDLADTLITIGRAEDNALVIAEKESSRYHCRIEKTEAGYKLVDLESRNGTRVNGKTVNQHLLEHGDRIEIGKTVILIDDPILKAAASPPAPAAKLPPVPEKQAAAERIERQSSEGEQSLLKAVAIGAALFGGFVLVLILFTFMSSTSPEERKAQKDYAEALELKKKDPRKALELLRAIPPTADVWFQKAREEIPRLEEHVETSVTENPKTPEDAEFLAIQKMVESWISDPDRVITLCKEFEANHPSSPHKTAILGFTRKAEEEKQKGKNWEFQKILQSVDRHLREYSFARALEEWNAFHSKYANDIILRPRIDEERKKVVHAGIAYFKERDREGDRLRSTGNSFEARLLYEALTKSLGEERIEEFREYCILAKTKANAPE